ncbi:MAG: hypothetical protein WEB59_00635 [Thermoanaerobaculia bacterium]
MLTILLPGGVLASQEAKQGSAKDIPVEPTSFVSPMVLETVFPVANPETWMDTESLQPGKKPEHVESGWFSVPEWYRLGKYTCDGVSLREAVSKGVWGAKTGVWEQPGLQMRVDRDEKTTVKVKAIIYNPPSNHDKRVRIQFDVLTSNGVLMSETGVRDVEETVKFHFMPGTGGKAVTVKFLFTPEELAQVTGLRLTISTLDY